MTQDPGRRSGFTLVELLVVVSIIAVLVGLLLPAVQAAREAARQAGCAQNLKQMALAVHHYHDTFGKLPLGEMPGTFSPNVAILPYLEQSALYNAINFIVLQQPGFGPDGRKPTWLDAISQTVAQARVSGYVCPSEDNVWVDDPDPPYNGQGFWAANYAWNSGTWWPRGRTWDGLFGRTQRVSAGSGQPPDPPLGSIGLEACWDGTSATLLLSEVANGPILSDAPRNRVSECYRVPGLNDKMTEAQAVAACDGVSWSSGPLPWSGQWRYKGYPWLEGTLWRGWFNTLRRPNQTCCTGGLDGDWWFTLKPASSYHPGGVNVAMADGSVRAVRETVDRAVWMALSTRGGQEAVPADAY